MVRTLMVLMVLMALADALVIGAQAGAVSLVVRAGGYGETDILESVRRLNQANQLWLPLPR
ncbi:hypothetical protein GTP44_12270 [Duganella sp. FT50W]|uniref:Uncharacterized protein n=1 Tax=Duganella lactea TaxID=2692173 RepID=A0A6L8MI13_9BURK|nr:CpsD/CapB family tyrosine-protein kinase [Duganella lactea]MYM82730.1 hypothetical protein [Duganella lactea]